MLTRQIRDGVDIVDLVGSYVSLRRAGANFKGLCPFHEEKTPSFTVHPAKQIFKCFGCGAGGDVFTFVQLKEHVDFLEARRILADRAGVSLEEDTSGTPGGPRKTDLARVNDWARRVFRQAYESPAGEAVRSYVVKRGISDSVAESFSLGLAVDSYDGLIRRAATSKVGLKLMLAAGLVKESNRGGYYDTFRNRLMFPITDATGRVVGFGGRALGDDPAKYLNTPATALFDKSTNLFGLEAARERISERKRAVVVEGYTDCIMAHQHGFAETVATLGTAMTEQHASLLRRYTDRVILLFDSDEAGQRAADRALAVTLTVGLDVCLARVPEGKDPCDYLLSAGTDAFESVLNDAVGALEFKWRQVALEYEASATGPGRRRAIEAYLDQLAAWLDRGAVDPIQMGLLLNQVGRLLSLPAEELHRQLRGRRRRVTASSRGPGPAEREQARQAVSARQAALRQVVEVLLNEPEIYHRRPELAGHLDPAAIEDPALAAVAGVLRDTLEAGEPLRLDEFIGQFGSAAFGQLITDLQLHGERRGRYEEVAAAALMCLESFERSCRTAMLAEEIRRQRGQSTGAEILPATAPGGEDEQLLALTESARNPQFATARARRRFLNVSGDRRGAEQGEGSISAGA
jgi:DNA primase